MFKFSNAINLGVATVLVLPALTLQGPPASSLEDALAKTVQALESLAGLERRVVAHETEAVPQVLRWTEPALPATEERDERLGELRLEVERLQAELDLLTPLGSLLVAPDEREARALESPPAVPRPPAPPTIGLDDALRKRIAGMPVASVRGEGAPPTASSAPRAIERSRFEPEGYSADSLRLGRAYFRQENYLQGLAVLEPLASDPDALYWKARCLEKLGRTSEALAAFEKVCADAGAGEVARRAKDDLEFLAWRSAFQKKLDEEKRERPR